jgi:hypothetical protein
MRDYDKKAWIPSPEAMQHDPDLSGSWREHLQDRHGLGPASAANEEHRLVGEWLVGDIRAPEFGCAPLKVGHFGRAGLCGEGLGLLVAAVVVALFLLPEVEVEVVIEVAVAGEGAELQDGFGAVEAPPGPGDFHAVLDEPPGRSFYKAAGHQPAGLEEGGVAQVVLLVFQVAGAFAGAGALGGAVSPGGGAADPGADIAVFPGQDLRRLLPDPVAGGGLAGVEERVSGLLQGYR